jgi:hypothetical protein
MFGHALRNGNQNLSQAASLIDRGSSWDLSVFWVFINTEYYKVFKISILLNVNTT